MHEKCSMQFFGTPFPPALEYSLDQMEELAKKVVERSISVPGVQPKLSLSLIKEPSDHSDNRLTVVGALGGYYILKPPSDLFPEISGNQHRFTVRFHRWRDISSRPIQTDEDVTFFLACC